MEDYKFSYGKDISGQDPDDIMMMSRGIEDELMGMGFGGRMGRHKQFM